MLENKLRTFNLQLFAEGGAGDGGQGGEGGGAGGAAGGDGGQGGTAGNGKTFTQEELDAIIAKRLNREKKNWESDLEKERQKAQMTEAEKLKAEKEEAEKKSKTVLDSANQRLITAEAKVQAAALGVNPDKISYVLKLADLSGVEVDDKGEVDTKAAMQAVEAVLKALPELKGAAGHGGFNMGGNPGQKGAAGGMNAFIRMAAGRM